MQHRPQTVSPLIHIVYIALERGGDTDDSAMTVILIFGETHFSSTSAISLTIRVARITPATRAPRPDDPTPLKPPFRILTRKRTIRELAANTRIKVIANRKGEDPQVVRRAREVMLHLPNSKPRGRRVREVQGYLWYIQSTCALRKAGHPGSGRGWFRNRKRRQR
ncbi:uncharacterized protein EDB91DRAFT_899528 [Suillus paluster]|uniref:uncharacterized protein n=1 Tax=Suillus paluster TaxID=48578 RepID=UPI001B85DF18|nr:uncharacterized protein EDB91DRAFT_899528 [Suillus paluster]KAG1726966.1 hypothetical protein EDB91DRAFT_899528 [Suillus paluster]